MKDLITINNNNLKIKEFNNQRVVTFKDIDMVHQRPDGTAKRNFLENKDKFIEGVDYYELSSSQKNEIRTLEIPNRGITVLTASGYLMLVKSLKDDLAWNIQRELVNNYFTIQKLKREYHKPIDRAIKQHFNIAGTIIQATGIKPGLAYSVAISEAEKETGYKYEEYKKLLPSAEHDVASYNPTQIGELLGNVKAQEVNKRLEQLGLQEKKNKNWRMTEQGKQFGEEKPYSRNGHTDYRILWNEKVLEKLGGKENV